MKIKLFLVILLIGFISCNAPKKNKENATSQSITKEETTLHKEADITTHPQSKGYKLMQQKCYICHLEVPDPSKRDQMIAPPMLRVQEHYKPTYPHKEEFVKAIMAFTKNPSEEKTLMPGAVKKFNLMPKLPYDDAELQLIAETIYEHEFGQAPKTRMQQMGSSLQLNNGKKWVLEKESIQQINTIIKKTTQFKATNIEAYQTLGKAVFNDAKKIMLNDAYKDELFDQIHNFFAGIEGNMHALMAVTSINEAEKQLTELNKKLQDFHNYFE
ncbi:hypothetical protein [uncultured Polaribacter sp.]|uniref:hypothetical protein n=1 Tax=uncultured Polaribacter sp. TaxID=174711 RepID=UPI0030DC97E9